MADKFPEAFDRYEFWLKDHDLDMPTEWDLLLHDMKVWGGRKFRGTRNQVEALKDIARTKNISGIPDELAPEQRPIDYHEYQEQQEELERTKREYERQSRGDRSV